MFQQGWDFVQQVPRFAQQFSGQGQQPAAFAPTPQAPFAGDAPVPAAGGPMTFPTYPPTPSADAPAAPAAVSPAADAGQIDQLLQALRQRNIPPLPGPYGPPPTAPAAAPGDPMSMLRLILSNPQFLQALQSTSAPVAARPVQLPVPVPTAPQQMQQMPIPLGAVLNAIVALAGSSMSNLSAGAREDEPEVPAYLVDADGRFIVDPANMDDRAALVTHLFRLSAEAQGAGEGWLAMEQDEAIDDSVDEGEATEGWA